MQQILPLIAIVLMVLPAAAAESRDVAKEALWIGLANNAESEVRMAAEVRALRRNYDIEPWLLTSRILIDRDEIPHSHPVLTLHTRYIGDEVRLLSTFIHEQLHWLEQEPWLERFRNAMAEYERVYPVTPSSGRGGARDRESTYRHLLVCDMELQVLTTLVGRERARETLAATTHYQWIYDRVLNDPQVRDIALRHGFDVAQGLPTQ